MRYGHGLPARESIIKIENQIELLKKLGVPLPSEAIQRTKDRQTHKGYDTDGYNSQFVANRLNDVVGGEWGLVWELVNADKGVSSKGKTAWDVAVKVGVWIFDKEHIRWQAGGHVSKTFGDALKGAVTDGFKKTAALWGAGKQPWEGALDNGNDPWPEWYASQDGGNTPPNQQASQGPSYKQQSGKGERQPQSQPPGGSGNGNGSGQQQAPPTDTSTPPVGNGQEAGLRRRILAKLKAVYKNDESKIFQAISSVCPDVRSVNHFNRMNANALNNLLIEADKIFQQWRSQQNAN